MKAHYLAIVCILALTLPASSQSTATNTLVLIADYEINGYTYPAGVTQDSVQKLMFSDPNGFSVREAFAEASYGQFLLTGDVNPTHTAPYHIVVPANLIGTDGLLLCGAYVGLGNMMDSMSLASGADPAHYQRWIYVLPPNAGCNGAFQGETAGLKTYIFQGTTAMTYEHEIGHTLLGPNHTVDDADPMNSQNVTVRLFNAAGTQQAGWMAAAGISTIAGDGPSYTLAPLEFTRTKAKTLFPGIPSTAGTQIYLLNTTAGTYTLSYRQPYGVDRDLDRTNLSAVRINRVSPPSNDGFARNLIGSVAPGAALVLDGVTITNNWATSSALNFAIAGLGPAPPPQASLSSLSLNPTSAGVGSPVTGTVTLSAAASTATTVSLSIDKPQAASIPASVTVSTGHTTGSFTITPANVSAQTIATITATYAGIQRTAQLTVLPPPPASCQPNATTLCLLNGRFSVTATYINQTAGQAQAVPVSGTTAYGYFWFTDPSNTELAVKIIDGTTINGSFWVYYGGLTTLDYTITVTDMTANRVKSYENPSGSTCGGEDTSFNTAAASLHGLPTTFSSGMVTPPASCSPSATLLCLQPGGDTFMVQTTYGSNGAAQGGLLPNTGAGAYFTFFNAGAVDLMAKVLDGRTVNGSYWAFSGGLSDSQYSIKFTNVRTGQWMMMSNASGNYCGGASINLLPAQ